MSPQAYDALIDAIMMIFLKNGLKATTMDSIAAKLQISKRTLYEIFSSKTEMVTCALEAFHKRHTDALKEIFHSSKNVMEGILRGFFAHRDVMSRANVNFFRDLDSIFAESRNDSNHSKLTFLDNYVRVLEKGVEEGFFRSDVNFMLQCRLQWIQMESLKRMEEFFPPDITLLEAYDSISIGFLRSISTQKGLEMLDKTLETIKSEKKDIKPTETTENETIN